MSDGLKQCRATSPDVPGLRCERMLHRALSGSRYMHDGWHRAETPDSTPELPKVASWR